MRKCGCCHKKLTIEEFSGTRKVCIRCRDKYYDKDKRKQIKGIDYSQVAKAESLI